MTEGEEVDHDDVLQELDICLSNVDDLFVLQYPLQPGGSSSTDHSSIRQAFFKPAQLKWQIVRSLDTSSLHYDKGKGEQIATVLKSGGKDAAQFTGNKLDTQKYVSSNTGGLCNNANALAVVKDGTLFLHPIKAVVQMRPSFDYADATETAQKSVAAVVSESEKSGPEESEQETAQAVTVRFAKEETDQMKKRREASFHYQEKLKAEEAWIPLDTHGTLDANSVAKRCSLVSCPLVAESFEPLSLSCDPGTYLRLLAPKPAEEKLVAPSLPTNTVSLADLRQMPLPEQIRSLMLNVKVIRMRQLLALLPPAVDEQLVLRHLQQYAVLVRGCWVVKSSILYLDDSKSPKTGVAGSLLCKARDLILYKFLQCAFLVRKQILEMVKIPSDDLSDIFSQVARFRLQKGWEFLYPQDDDFLDKHKDISERQCNLWETRFQQIMQTFSQSRTRRVSGMASPAAGRVRRRTGSKSFSMSSEDDLSLATEGSGRSRKRRASSRQHSGNISTLNLDNTINAIVSDSLPPDEADTKQTLISFLRTEFDKCPVQSLAEIRRFFLLSLADSGKSLDGFKEPDNDLIEQCALSLQAEKIQVGTSNLEAQTLYVATGEEPWPEVKRLLLATLREQRRVKFAEFRDAVVRQFQTQRPSDAELRKILKAYCSQKGGFYTLLKI